MYRFFKCNVLGGFRISDLNRNLKQGEYIYIEKHVCETSRAVKAALEKDWMLEVGEKEASQFIPIPRDINRGGVQIAEIGPRRAVSSVNKLVANTSETNKSLESRQTARSIKRAASAKQKTEDKVIVPDFNKADRAIRNRQEDVMTKGPDEVLKSPVGAESSARTFRKVEEKKPEVIIASVDDGVVKDLSQDVADNEMLSTPDFNEKKEEIKEGVQQEVEKRVRRRRRTTVSEEV